MALYNWRVKSGGGVFQGQLGWKIRWWLLSILSSASISVGFSLGRISMGNFIGFTDINIKGKRLSSSDSASKSPRVDTHRPRLDQISCHKQLLYLRDSALWLVDLGQVLNLMPGDLSQNELNKIINTPASGRALVAKEEDAE